MQFQIHYEKFASELGNIHLFANDLYLLGVYFDRNLQLGLKLLGSDALKPTYDHHLLKQARTQLSSYLDGERQTFDLPLLCSGTPFQLSAWRELAKIPYGTTISYQQQAAGMGQKSAVRAVANANGKNRYCIVVPCHRVIASDGGDGGYAGGLEVKRRLLQLEARTTRRY